MSGTPEALDPDAILELLPQVEPFRFVDRILGVDEHAIRAEYRFRPDHEFYRGHFPGRPVTPGVILLESMAQVSVVALGIYVLALEGGRELVERRLALFTDAEVEFAAPVDPGTRVIIEAERVFYRRGKLRSRATMHREDGELACSGVLSGVAVPR